MTTFKQFVDSGSSRSKSISEEQALELIKSHCMDFVKNAKVIPVRGISGRNSKFLSVDPSSMIRTSRNTRNYYTLLLDNLSSWSKYPKRSESIICSNDINGASSFGTPYLVIPYDNAKWGVCHFNDLWFSFNLGLQKEFSSNKGVQVIVDMSEFNDILERMCFLTTGKVLSGKNWEQFTSQIEEMEQVFKKEINSEEILNDKLNSAKVSEYVKGDYLAVFNSFKRHNFNILKSLESVLDPDKNKFKLVNSNNLSSFSAQQQEIWTDSKCVMISASFLYDTELEFDREDITAAFRQYMKKSGVL